MEFSLNDAMNASAEIADSINYPNLRLATVAERQSNSPQLDVASKADYIWRAAGPDAFAPVNTTSPKNPFTYFSAVCYFFGRDLYKHLNKQSSFASNVTTIPIGLIASDVGGVKIETLASQVL